MKMCVIIAHYLPPNPHPRTAGAALTLGADPLLKDETESSLYEACEECEGLHGLVQAKLHVALELGDSTGDKGFSLVGKGPPATGEKPDNSIELSRSVPAASKQEPSIPAKAASSGATEEDARLRHSAAQVWGNCSSTQNLLGCACIPGRLPSKLG